MRINGMSISVFNARQWTVEREHSEIANQSEWVDGTRIPVMLGSTFGLKKIKVGVMLYGKSRDELWKNGSNLIAALAQPTTINLDGFEHNFFLSLKNASQAEKTLKRWHKATLEFIGYEYGNQTTISPGKNIFTVDNPGNMETPLIIELLPTIGKVNMTISGVIRDSYTGADRPLIINGLTKDKKIIIDGETNLVTEEGVNKFGDTEMYDFPSLAPGENQIITDQPDVSVTVKYRPRYI